MEVLLRKLIISPGVAGGRAGLVYRYCYDEQKNWLGRNSFLLTLLLNLQASRPSLVKQ